MSDERKTPAEYLADHLREVATIYEDAAVGKKMVGLMTIVCYEDGRHYPHCSGYIDHARALGIAQTYLMGLALNDHERWVRNSIERRNLERGL